MDCFVRTFGMRQARPLLTASRPWWCTCTTVGRERKRLEVSPLWPSMFSQRCSEFAWFEWNGGDRPFNHNVTIYSFIYNVLLPRMVIWYFPSSYCTVLLGIWTICQILQTTLTAHVNPKWKGTMSFSYNAFLIIANSYCFILFFFLHPQNIQFHPRSDCLDLVWCVVFVLCMFLANRVDLGS